MGTGAARQGSRQMTAIECTGDIVAVRKAAEQLVPAGTLPPMGRRDVTLRGPLLSS